MSAALSKMSAGDLARVFAALAVQQYDEMLGGPVAQVGRLYHKLKAVELELKSRPGDQRRMLMELCNYPNPKWG